MVTITVLVLLWVRSTRTILLGIARGILLSLGVIALVAPDSAKRTRGF